MVIQGMIVIGGRNLALSILCNIILPVQAYIHLPPNLYSLTGKFNQPGYVGVHPRSNLYKFVDN